MSIAELSIKRPVSTIMLFVSLVVIGLIAAFRLPLEAFPEVSPPFIFVQMPYAGSTPEEVERTVLRPVEETLSTMAGIKRIDASANADGAQIFLVHAFAGFFFILRHYGQQESLTVAPLPQKSRGDAS